MKREALVVLVVAYQGSIGCGMMFEVVVREYILVALRGRMQLFLELRKNFANEIDIVAGDPSHGKLSDQTL